MEQVKEKRVSISDARVISLEEAYLSDKSIGSLVNMDYGQTADRENVDSEWIIN